MGRLPDLACQGAVGDLLDTHMVCLADRGLRCAAAQLLFKLEHGRGNFPIRVHPIRPQCCSGAVR
jgi:hypothetical protein